MAKKKEYINELIQEIIDRFAKLGYVVEDISEDNPTMAHCRFYIYQKDQPEINAYALDGEELETMYNNLINRFEKEKCTIKLSLPTNSIGTIMCQQISEFTPNDTNTYEVSQCIRLITKEKFIYCSTIDGGHRTITFYSEKLRDMGLESFKMDSGAHVISVWEKGNGWYYARRYDVRDMRHYSIQLRDKEKR